MPRLSPIRGRSLSGPVIQLLARHNERCLADRAAWQAHLDRLGIAALEVLPDPVQIATEGALWGSVKAHGLLPDAVIVSDDAGQFSITPHALCRFIPSDWSINSTPSLIRTTPSSSRCAASSGGSITT
jgi:hypothetical protein